MKEVIITTNQAYEWSDAWCGMSSLEAYGTLSVRRQAVVSVEEETPLSCKC